MKQKLAKSLVCVIIIGLGLWYSIHQSEHKREAIKSENFDFKFVDMAKVMEQRFKVVEEVKVVEDIPKRPEYKNVKLPSDIKDYIFDKSIKYNFSYELLLAIIQLESNFDTKLISKTDDYGLAQLHGSTARWIAKQMKLEDYNLFNPKTNIDFSVFYLDYLRTYWKSQGLDNESLFPALVISYNRGEINAKRYIRRYGTESNAYLRKVREFKEAYEQEVQN